MAEVTNVEREREWENTEKNVNLPKIQILTFTDINS